MISFSSNKWLYDSLHTPFTFVRTSLSLHTPFTLTWANNEEYEIGKGYTIFVSITDENRKIKHEPAIHHLL